MTPRDQLQAVLFDWDGTLLDSYHADLHAYLAMFREMGVRWGPRKLDRHYTPDWYRVYRAAGIPEARWEEADACWRGHYARHRSELMPGARRVLSTLQRRYSLGLVTSGDRNRVMRQLRSFRLLPTFPVRICGDDVIDRKPHPFPLQLAMRKMKMSPDACVYVGDTAEDLQMARAAGVRSISIRGPFPTAKKLAAEKPEFYLDSIRELPPLLRSLYGSRRK